MDLSDALGGWPADGNNQSKEGSVWPGQPPNHTWPGGPTPNSTWPGGPTPNPTWPVGPGGPTPNSTWPGGPNPNSTWPGGPTPDPNPTWPGGPTPKSTWPGGPTPDPNPTWPGGPTPKSTWPGGPTPCPNPTWPGGPTPNPPGPGQPNKPSAPAQEDLTVPYHRKLPRGVYDKLLITIAGTVKLNADKFTVDLNTPHDLAFHFNPRFNEYGKKVIVRNTCCGHKWGPEERELRTFPFVPGKPFEMKILCTTSEFRVAVNNSHLLEYKHRIKDLSSIKDLNITNDVTLSKVHMETLP